MTNLILPTIDISGFFSQNASIKKHIAKQIDLACRDVGFFLITGHGISKAQLEQFYKILTDFFALPLQQKLNYHTNKTTQEIYHFASPYGYTPLELENVYSFMGEKGPNDIVEKISTGPAILGNTPINVLSLQTDQENLQQNLKNFYAKFQNIGFILSELFAIAVDLPPDFFIKKMDKAFDAFRCNHYPSNKNYQHDNGIAPHTDMGLLTILTQQTNGLEIMDKHGIWHPILVDSPDTFIINIGDLMMHWSNNEWTSTKHRVKLTNESRLSTVFFKVVNEDTNIECIPKFCEDHSALYAPILYKAFAEKKMSGLFKDLA